MSVGPSQPIRIIGLGNALRGDDAVGLLAARRLSSRVGERTHVIEAEMAGMEILDLMTDARVVILIDAVQSGQGPGTIHRLDASAGPIGSRLVSHSTHAMSPADTIELARTLGVLPPIVILYGVEVGDTGAGRSLSPEVARSLDEVVERVWRESEAAACTNSIS
jgi:hydrogenase maturation protease